MIKLVSENPFRILGVLANAQMREISSNKSKAQAFLKVNRAVTYPLDLPGLLPPIARTAELMNQAEAHLAVAKEKLLYMQFWLLSLSNIDQVALNNLTAGRTDEALAIWAKKDDLSSLQNRAVVYLMRDDLHSALPLFEKLYADYGSLYINNVDKGSTLRLTADELIGQMAEALSHEADVSRLLSAVTSDQWRQVLSSQAITPLKDLIDSEVQRAKARNQKDSEECYKAGKALMDNTRQAIAQLKAMLPEGDAGYQMTADKLGITILQCAIDFYNSSDDPQDAHRALVLQQYALDIVVGSMARERCADNVKVLKNNIASLSPAAVAEQDKALREALAVYNRSTSNNAAALQLLNTAIPLLQAVKREIGPAHSYYISMSTTVANAALNAVIDDVNKAMETPPGQQYLSDTQRLIAITVIKQAWNQVIPLLDNLDRDRDAQIRYSTQKGKLKDLYDAAVPTSTAPPVSNDTSSDDSCLSNIIQAAIWIGVAILLKTCM